MPKYRKLPLDVLFIDKDYQRSMDETRILRMAEKYNPDRLGHLSVSDRRNGTYAVMDGQHRLLMAEVLELKELPCDVFDYFAEAEAEGVPVRERMDHVRHKEAEFFDTQADERRALRPYHEFRSRAFRGAEPEATVYRVIQESGMRLGQTTKPGTVAAVKSVLRVFDQAGEEGLAQVLNVANRAWSAAAMGVPGQLLEGLSLWIQRSDGHFAEKELIHRLSMHEPDVIVGRARSRAARYREGGSAVDFVADEITRIRNMRRRRAA